MIIAPPQPAEFDTWQEWAGAFLIALQNADADDTLDGEQLDGPVHLESYIVAEVPDAAAFTGFWIYVSDETGGAVPAFSNGTNWLRCQDLVIIS